MSDYFYSLELLIWHECLTWHDRNMLATLSLLRDEENQ